ncbi:MAG: VOC family protein [Candidatus Dormiibacterota bacterium]
MRDSGDVFHVAIPAYDLQAAQHFYVDLLGCKLARHYDDRITLDFFGDQVVCHLTAGDPGSKGGPESMYPRHFGVTFRHGEDFDAVHEVAVMREIPFFSDLTSRFEGRAEVHRTFVLRDPSDNLIEFKHYRDHRMMY